MRKLKLEELGRISVEEYNKARKSGITLVADNIRSMANVGSLFRTADAFRINKLYLCGISPKPPHREINKTALGATDSVEWDYISSTIECIQRLKEESNRILALEQADQSIPLQSLNFQSDQKLVLIVGNEVEGVSEEVLKYCDDVIEIPQFGTKHSLNVSVSTGIALWEMVKNRLTIINE